MQRGERFELIFHVLSFLIFNIYKTKVLRLQQ